MAIKMAQRSIRAGIGYEPHPGVPPWFHSGCTAIHLQIGLVKFQVLGDGPFKVLADVDVKVALVRVHLDNTLGRLLGVTQCGTRGCNGVFPTNCEENGDPSFLRISSREQEREMKKKPGRDSINIELLSGREKR